MAVPGECPAVQSHVKTGTGQLASRIRIRKHETIEIKETGVSLGQRSL